MAEYRVRLGSLGGGCMNPRLVFALLLRRELEKLPVGARVEVELEGLPVGVAKSVAEKIGLRVEEARAEDRRVVLVGSRKG